MGEEGGRNVNGFDFRRAVLVVNGNITDNWSAMFMHEFKTGSVLEAYLEYKLADALKFRLGQFKNPFSLDNQISPTAYEFIHISALATDYYTYHSPANRLSGGLGGGGRDQGFMMFGNAIEKEGYHALNYNLAVMNGQGINVRDRNTQKDLIATLGYRPCKDLVLQASVQEGRGSAVEASSYHPDINAGDNFRRTQWSVGAELKTDIVDARSEYMSARYDDVDSHGYYATAALHVCDHLDLALSYDHLNRNKDMGDRAKQTNYSVGTSYWFYPKCRLQLVYTYRDAHEDALRLGNLLQAGIQVRF